jgi:hypothetical protein
MADTDFVTEIQITNLENAIAAAIVAQKALSWTYIDARADAATARPTGWAGIIWLCDATGNATNAVVPDIIIREDEAV